MLPVRRNNIKMRVAYAGAKTSLRGVGHKLSIIPTISRAREQGQKCTPGQGIHPRIGPPGPSGSQAELLTSLHPGSTGNLPLVQPQQWGINPSSPGSGLMLRPSVVLPGDCIQPSTCWKRRKCTYIFLFSEPHIYCDYLFMSTSPTGW